MKSKIEEDFRNMVATLEKDPAEIKEGLDNEMTSKIHAGMGLCGEAVEILEGFYGKEGKDLMENMLEELGDFEFYLRMVYSRYGLARITITPEEAPEDTIEQSIRSLVINSGTILDLIKKECIYQNGLDDKKTASFMCALYTIELNLHSLRRHLFLDRDYILKTVMEKLFKRYPNFVYSNKRAEERLDKK